MKSKSLILVILNSITLAIMLFVNYASNAKIFFVKTVADVSHKYDSLFAPAGYTFIIWSLIFIAAICFVIFQWTLLKSGDPKKYISRTGIWFMVSNIANAAWIYFWIYEQLGWSVFLIFVLLISLIILIKRLRLELDDEPVSVIFFVWWPVVYYIGWIMVACIACTASWLVSLSWAGLGISQNIWAIIMMAIAFLLYILLIQKRNMRETALIGAWAFVGIAVRQWHAHHDVVIATITFALALIIASGIHGYKNRKYAPASKLKRGEW